MRSVGERQLIKYLYILYFIWPVLGIIYTLKYIHTSTAKIYYILFFALVGFTYTIGNTGYDTYAYYQWFQIQSFLTYGDYWTEILKRFSVESLKPEIFQYSIEFWISRVTDNASVYFCVLSGLLGIGVVKNLSLITGLYSKNKTLYGLLFIFFLLVLLSPLRIASFRHYFAALVFVFSAYQVIVNNDKRYLLGILSTVLIHIGFSIGIVLFAVYYFLGNRFWLYAILAIGCYILSESFITLMIEHTDIFSGDFKTKAAAYSYEGFIKDTQKSQEKGIFLLKILIDWTRVFFISFTTYWYFKVKNIDKGTKGLYFLGVIFFSFTILTNDILAISNRFSVVYFILCCVFFVRLFSIYRQRNNYIFLISTIFILGINFIVIGRQTAEFLNASILLPLLPIQLFIESELLLIDVVNFFR